MKKEKLIFILIIIFIFFFYFSCSAKNPTIRSDIKKKIDYLITQGNGYFLSGQVEKALANFSDAFDLATTIDDVDRIIKTSLKLIEVYIYLNQPDKAFPLLTSCKKLAEKEDKKNFFSQIFFFFGKYYELKQNLDNAIANYKESINKATNEIDKAIAMNGLGLLYLKSKKYDEALPYLLEAYKINKKQKNYDQLANNCFNISQCYLNKKDFSKSLEYALEALNCDKISENQFNILEDCKLLAKIYEYMNNIEMAIYYMTKAINIAQIIAKDQVQFLTSELKRLQGLIK